MKLIKHLQRFSPSALRKAGKFQSKAIKVIFVLLLSIISLKALLTCYNINAVPLDITAQEIEIPIQSFSLSSYDNIAIVENITPTVTPTIAPTATPEPEVIEYDPPETIFDWFKKEEIEMLYRLVEAEATSGTVEDKINVANVVYNRFYSKEFPDTIKGVIFQDKQFSCIGDGRYYKVKVTEDTKEAVYRAFMEPDTTDGALFFCNKADVKNSSYKKWFNSLDYVMTDDIGHSYYK